MGVKKIGRQIYARIWYYLRCFRLLFVRIPETPDGKSQEQLLQTRKKSNNRNFICKKITGKVNEKPNDFQEGIL